MAFPAILKAPEDPAPWDTACPGKSEPTGPQSTSATGTSELHELGHLGRAALCLPQVNSGISVCCSSGAHRPLWPLWNPRKRKKISRLRVLFPSILMKELGTGECCFGGRAGVMGKPQSWLSQILGQADWRTHRGPERRNRKRQGGLSPGLPVR